MDEKFDSQKTIIVSPHSIKSFNSRSKKHQENVANFIKSKIIKSNRVFKKSQNCNNRDPSLYFLDDDLIYVVSSKKDAYIVSTVYRNERKDRFIND